MVNSPAQRHARERRPERRTTPGIVESALVSAGVAFVVCAALARQPWLDRHFLPSWFVPHRWYVTIESSVRVLMAAAGLWLALAMRGRIARLIATAWQGIVFSALAAVLALAASE